VERREDGIDVEEIEMVLVEAVARGVGSICRSSGHLDTKQHVLAGWPTWVAGCYERQKVTP
jgi:hypothetical protein